MGQQVDSFLSSIGMNKQASMEKTAEEMHLEKLAHVNETVEASTALRLVGENLAAFSQSEGLTKQASEMLVNCAEGLFVASDAFMGGLQKQAAENTAGMLVDMIHTADGLTKISHTLNAIVEGGADEDFVKLANTVTSINNALVAELNELAKSDKSVANYIDQVVNS